MITVVIMVIVTLILASVFIQGSWKSIDQATETKYLQEITEIKKGVNTKRLSNSKKGLDEETLNQGFIKVRVQDAPTTFESFDEEEITGYVVDLHVIEYEKSTVGQGYLDFVEDDLVKFNVDDVYVYDAMGTVYYAKGLYASSGENVYTDTSDIARKDGPIIEVVSTTEGHIELKVTPYYGGAITSVMVGTEKAKTIDGKTFTCDVPDNGTYIVIATEEGGNSTRITVTVTDMVVVIPVKPVINSIRVESGDPYINEKVVTLHIDATSATHMYVSTKLKAVSASTTGWKEYDPSTSITLKEGENKIYVWCKNEVDQMADGRAETSVIVDTIAPSKDEPSYVISGYSMTIHNKQTDATPVTVEFGYRDAGTTDEYTWQETNRIEDAAPGQKMDIKTRAKDAAGNVSESRVTTTEAFPTIPSDITITETPKDVWSTSKVITIEYPDTYGVYPYKNYYRIDDGEWQEVTSDKETIKVIKNSLIEAVVSAQFNSSQTRMGDIKEFEVSKVDRNKPELISLLPEESDIVYDQGYDITVTAQDFESGLVAWEVTTENIEPEYWSHELNETNELTNLIFRAEQNGKYYVWAKDAVGLVNSVVVEVKNIDLIDPEVVSYDVTYGKAQATLTAIIKDESLGLAAYGWTKGKDAKPEDVEWIPLEKTTQTEVTHVVTENDAYTIWVQDVGGRITRAVKDVKVIFSVTYDYKTNGGTSIKGDGLSSTNNVLYVGCNMPVDLTPTSVRSKSTFLGWSRDPHAQIAETEITMGTKEDIVLYAIFSKEITLNFYYYEGTTQKKQEVKAYLYNQEETVEVEIPEITAVFTDWTSRGWTLSTAHDASVEYTLVGSTIEVDDHTDIYMLYERNLAITYKYFKSSSYVDLLPIYTNTYDVTVTTSATSTAPEIALNVKKQADDNSWNFRGWSLDATANAEIDLVNKGQYETKQDVTFYATYESEVSAFKYTHGNATPEEVTGTAYLAWNGTVINAKINLGTAANTTYKSATWTSEGWSLQKVATGLIEVPNNGDAEIYINTNYYAIYSRDVKITTKIFNDQEVVVSAGGLLNATGDVFKAIMTLPEISDISLSGLDWLPRGYSFDDDAQAEIDFEENDEVMFDEDVTLYASYYRIVNINKVNFYGTDTTSHIAYSTYKGEIDKVVMNIGTVETIYFNGENWEPHFWTATSSLTAEKVVDLNGTIETIKDETYYMLYGRDVTITRHFYDDETSTVEGKALLDTGRNILPITYVTGEFEKVVLDGVDWEAREWCSLLNYLAEDAKHYSKEEERSTYKDEDIYAIYGDTLNIDVYTLDKNGAPKYVQLYGTRIMTVDGKIISIQNVELPELEEVTKDELIWTPLGYLASEDGYNLTHKDGVVSKFGGDTILPTKDSQYFAIYETNATITKVLFEDVKTEQHRITLNSNAEIGGTTIRLGTITNAVSEERVWQGFGWDDDAINYEAPKYMANTEILIEGNRTFYAAYLKEVALEHQEYQTENVTKSTFVEGTAYMSYSGETKAAEIKVVEPLYNVVVIENESWTYKGWSDSNELHTPITNAIGSTIELLDDDTIYARYERIITATLHVYLDAVRTATGSSEANTLGMRADSEIDFGEIESVNLNGSIWQPRGWSTDPAANAGASFINNFGIGKLSKDTDYYASYITDVTVTFISYSGETETIKNRIGTVYMDYLGNMIDTEIVTPSQDLYTGIDGGWIAAGYTEETLQEVDDSLIAKSKITTNKNRTFYGLYYRTLTLTYDPNGGTMEDTVSEGIQRVNSYNIIDTANPTIIVSTPVPKRTGYTFMNKWTEQQDVELPGYTIGESITISRDTTLYAFWERTIYRIDYNLNGGEGNFESQSKEHDVDIVLNDATPTRDGYVFKGWSTSEESFVVEYLPGDTYSINMSATLYAVWNQKLYALIYDDGTMGFNTTGTPKLGQTLADESYVWLLENEFYGTIELPWYGLDIKKEIVSVEFEEEIKPAWTAAWFFGFEKLEKIVNIENLNTKQTTVMSYMFEGCTNLKEIDLTGFNTSMTLGMKNMFKDCTSLQYIDISSFDISSLNTITNMFYNCTNLKTIISQEGFTMESVSEGVNVFRGCSSLVGGNGTTYSHENADKDMAKVDCGEGYGADTPGYFTGTNMRVYALYYTDGSLGFNTTGTPAAGKVVSNRKENIWVVPFAFENEDEVPWAHKASSVNKVVIEENIIPSATAWWFNNMSNLNSILNIEYMDTSRVRTMQGMFAGCKKITNISTENFNTSKVTDMSHMFENCTNVLTLDLRNFDTTNVTNMAGMFNGCEKANKIIISSFDTSNVTDMSSMFRNCKTVPTIDVRTFNTYKVTNMESMYEGAAKVSYLDLSSFNTVNVTNTASMFKNCSVLATIYTTEDFVTSGIAESTDMFLDVKNIIGGRGTEYVELAVDKAYARIDQGVTRAGYFTKEKVFALYYTDGSLEIKTTENPTAGKTLYSEDSYWAVAGKFASAEARPWDQYKDAIYTVSIEDIVTPISTAYWFANLTNISGVKNISNIDTSITKYMTGMFEGCTALTYVDVGSFKVAEVQNMDDMFKNCSLINELDFINWNTAKVKSTTNMFQGCIRLSKVDVGANCTIHRSLPVTSAEYIDGANGKWYNSIGQGFESAELPLEKIDTYYASVDMVPPTLAPGQTWYANAGENFDPSTITNIFITNEYTSSGRESASWYADEAGKGKITCYVVENVLYIVNKHTAYSSGAIMLHENASGTFAEFTSAKNINGLRLFNTIRTQNMDNMFGSESGGCTGVTKLTGFEKWNVSNVTSVDNMFYGCGAKDIDLSELDFTSLTDYSNMFNGSLATTIVIGEWNVENASSMFANCPNLQLVNLTAMNFTNLTNTQKMFENDTNLLTIYVDKTFVANSIVTSTNMFNNCTSILGGAGTLYDASRVDRRYAKIDEETAPGYLTAFEIGAGALSAKLYETGTVAATYVELSEEGVDIPAWNYSNGAKLLEVKASNLMAGEEKKVTIRVPTGMYIKKDSWTKVGEFSGITNVSFTTLDIDSSTSGTQQGTGTYTNAQTGTVTFTIGKYATYSKIQLLVMYDETIWDKCAGNGNLTKEPAVTVNLNDSKTLKANNVSAAVPYGGGLYLGNGTGTSNLYVGNDYEQNPVTSFYYIASNQASYASYYKSITTRLCLYSTDVSGETIYATFKDIYGSFSGQDNYTLTTSNGVTTIVANDVKTTSDLQMPKGIYTLEEDTGFIEGTKIFYVQEVVTVDYVGKVRTDTLTQQFTIGKKEVSYSNIQLSSASKSTVEESYHKGKAYYDTIGYMAFEYKGVADITDIDVDINFDVTTGENVAPTAKVAYMQVPLVQYTEAIAYVTLIDETGKQDGPFSTTISSTSNSVGARITAKNIASENGLTGTYYLKAISYNIAEIPGSLTTTRFYAYQATSSVGGSGTIGGWITGEAKHTMKLTYPEGTTPASVTASSTSKFASEPRLAGRIVSYGTPSGTSFEAGEDIVLDFAPAVSTYPYAETQHITKPVVYMVLPVGAQVKDAVFSTAQGGSSIATSVITVNKMFEKDGVIHNVYKIEPENEMHYGGITTNVGVDTTRWVRLTISTDTNMERTTLMLRDLVSFKDADLHCHVSGGQGEYKKSDTYDVDNDGLTSDTYGTISSTTASITIFPIEE